MSLALLFHYLMLNMFRMLIHPPSGACDLFVELFHVLYCSGSMCVGVTLWFGWGVWYPYAGWSCASACIRIPGSLSWASSIQSIILHRTSWRSILILSSHLRLGIPRGLFPSGFLTKTLYTPLLTPIHATCPAHLILFDFITRTIFGEQYRSLSSSLCSFLRSPVTSSLLRPKYSLQHPILEYT